MVFSFETSADLQDAVDKAQAAIKRGALAEAVEVAKSALEGGLQHPLLYNLLAYGLEEEGRLNDAFTVLQQSLEAAPHDPQTLHAMGLCLFRLGRPVEAGVAFDAALLQRPGFAPSLHHRGLAYQSVGAEDAAARCFESAAEADPAYPDPKAALADLAAGRGDLEGARRWAGEGLAVDDGNPTARLALARADLAEGDAKGAERRLRALLDHAALFPPDVPAITGFLADALDAQDRTDEAFAAYASAKARALAVNGEALRSQLDFRRVADTVAQGLEAVSAWPARPAGPPPAEAPLAHVFLVGFPRSGTTLLEQVLQSHPSIVSLDERATLEGLAASYLNDGAGFSRLLTLDGEALAAARDRYWAILAEGGVEIRGKVFIDKLPLNTIKLPLIARLFPEAKILFAIRDPRDVVFSCFRRTFRMNGAMREFATLKGAAAFYGAVMTCAERARAKLPLTLHEVRYEAVVADLRGEAEAAARFLGVPWSDAMMDFAALSEGRAISTPSAAQVRRGLYQEGVGQWRRYERHLEPVLPLLQPWLERFGYGA
jgi:tetratricopeptide (TPR) repeat protein